ncbi:hypothetical protein VTN49DRAFT_7283 [Thermomyces lanuginosus]|uniref:uncharacterized protein n=1 Tax=Thermomyces lanuginosus TaxID=5541 RepID=UPI00374255C2
MEAAPRMVHTDVVLFGFYGFRGPSKDNIWTEWLHNQKGEKFHLRCGIIDASFWKYTQADTKFPISKSHCFFIGCVFYP